MLYFKEELIADSFSVTWLWTFLLVSGYLKAVWIGKDIKYFVLEVSVETFQIPGVSWEQFSFTKAPVEVAWLVLEAKPKNLNWVFAADFWALLAWGP